MFKRLRGRGLKIKVFNAIIVSVVVVMSILVIASTIQLNVVYEELIDAEINYSQCVSSANMLQAGSDNLTRQMQYFAQTANLAYLRAYFDEVNSMRREQALAGLDVQEDEAELLNRAKQESDDLMTMEYHIMRLVTQSIQVTPEQLPEAVRDYPLNQAELSFPPAVLRYMARNMAFSEEYHSKKASIDTCVQNFSERIVARKFSELDHYSSQVNIYIYLQRILLCGLICVVLATGTLLYTQMISVLQTQVTHIIEDKPLEIRGVYELRYLSEVYNRLREKNRTTEKALEKRANLDALTGILNRGAFERMVQIKLSDGIGGVFVMVDADRFKAINDQYGHDAGDNILKRIADGLSSSFRDGDITGRLGGDEFGVWLSGLAADSIEYIQKRLSNMNERLLLSEDGLPPVSISAGIALITAHDDDYLSLFKRADAALYRAKANGGGQSAVSIE